MESAVFFDFFAGAMLMLMKFDIDALRTGDGCFFELEIWPKQLELVCSG